MHEDLLHIDGEREDRRLAVDRVACADSFVEHDAPLARHAERFGVPRHHEDKGDSRIDENVLVAVEAVVAEAIGNDERVFVEHFDKPGRIALRRHVEQSVRAFRRNDHEWTGADEPTGGLVNVIDLFVEHCGGRRLWQNLT